MHIANLSTVLTRGALHAPNTTPEDGLPWRSIHNVEVQAGRRLQPLGCGPGGTIHDYVPFYFGPLSPMLLNLKTGRVKGYAEGQAPLIYLKTAVQTVDVSGARWVFSDGHGLATFTRWFDDLASLDKVDWSLVGERYWADTPEDNDRQRRKQAEFLVWDFLDWSMIQEIGVLDAGTKASVEAALTFHPRRHVPPVHVCTPWYYY